MLFPEIRFVLGSRSPRRRELLQHLAPAESIEVLPPRSADEPGFDGLHDWPSIEQHLAQIARGKSDDVLDQIRARGDRHSTGRIAPGGGPFGPVVITADTMVVVRDDSDRLLVLGQPPEDDTWKATVRRWFREHYFGRMHSAVTAVCVSTLDGRRAERIVRTDVRFVPHGEEWLEWYLATGEPRGKAGGYALQGAGSLFVERIEGSPSNVIGLPLRELAELLLEITR